jgi:hypothetical protein
MSEKLSREIEVLFEQFPLNEEVGERVIKIGQFINIVSHRGFGVLFLLLSLPIALPFTPPGLSTPFGLLNILFGSQLLIGRKFPWLPHRISQKRLSLRVISFLKEKGLPFLRKMEKWSVRRLEFATQKGFRGVTGLIVLSLGAIMTIPIPSSNTLPAIVISIIGFGLANDDGLFILVGLVSGVITVAIYVAIALFAVGMIL